MRITAMSEGRTVVIGLLGSVLDSGYHARRWEKWRPTVSLCQQGTRITSYNVCYTKLLRARRGPRPGSRRQGCRHAVREWRMDRDDGPRPLPMRLRPRPGIAMSRVSRWASSPLMCSLVVRARTRRPRCLPCNHELRGLTRRTPSAPC